LQEGNKITNPGSVTKSKEKQAFGVKPSALSLTWSSAWKMSSFRWKFWIGMLIFIGILIALPFFFNAIEERNGIFIADIFLKWIPARNVSVAVFFLIWSCCLILIIRIYRDPMMLLVMLWAYNGVTLLRMACIGLISLNPPAGLIPLMDPITNQFYGQRYITHDLFFSGHTTTVFLIFLCLKNKYDRIYALFASILLGFLLLVQHVHYTIDVLGAPLFTYAVYRLTLIFTKRENQQSFPQYGKG
jgi:PAP2 superfamily C-terminal